ncbi:MAG TPA: hypothetical protein VNC50_14115 [Planctomycetia bacterium]|nr:hypothetical protein [Planctomycetia bacterium]
MPMSRRAFTGLAAGAALGAGALVARRWTRTSPPSAESIRAAIAANFESLGSFLASVRCAADAPAENFDNGTLAWRGEHDFRLDRGSRGDAIRAGRSGFNQTEPNSELLYSGRWDDPEVTARMNVAIEIGDLDLRRLVEDLAAGDFQVAADQDDDGGRGWLLAGERLRLRVDATAPHRVLQSERIDPRGGYRFDAFFSDWAPVAPGGAECFRSARCDVILREENALAISLEYSLSNLKTGARLDDSLFALKHV